MKYVHAVSFGMELPTFLHDGVLGSTRDEALGTFSASIIRSDDRLK